MTDRAGQVSTIDAAAIAAMVADPRRAPRFGRIRNFRDFGGYPTGDGGRVRWGVLYRSAKLCRLPTEDVETLAALGIRSVIDLRTAEERELEPSAWTCAAEHLVVSEKPSVTTIREKLRAAGGDVEAAEQVMVEAYAERPERFRAEYGAMFRMLAAGEVPLLVHCTAGKDRTGGACALVLEALGVPRDIIIADYALTSELLPMPRERTAEQAMPFGGRERPSTSLAQLPLGVRAAIWDAKPRYIAATLEAVDRDFGGVRGYLEAVGLSQREVAALRGLVE